MLNLYVVILAGSFSRHAVDIHSLCECYNLYGCEKFDHLVEVGVEVVHLDGGAVRVDEEPPLRSDEPVEVGDVAPGLEPLVVEEEVAGVDRVLVGAPHQPR